MLLPVHEVRHLMLFFSAREGDAIRLAKFLKFHHISNVIRKTSHRLKTLEIFIRIFIGEAMNHVPVLGARHDDVINKIVLVQSLEGRRVAASSARDDRSSD